MSMNNIPRVTYYNGNDATKDIDKIINGLTEVNIIRTKNLDKNLIKVLLLNKDRVYLHLLVNGMGGSEFEPNIQSPKTIFENLKMLIDGGFHLGKILIIVEPVIPNMVGLQSMELLLKVMIRYKGMRIRQVKFNILPFFMYDKNKLNKSKMSTSLYLKKQKELQENEMTYGNKDKGFLMLSNRNITNRASFKRLKDFVFHLDNKKGQGTFMTYFKQILTMFKDFIYIDTTTIEPIGIRELKAFGLRTTYIDGNGVGHKLISYDKKTKTLSGVQLLKGKNLSQCSNKCVLCPFK